MPGILLYHRYTRKSNAISLLQLIADAAKAISHARTFRGAVQEFIRLQRIPPHRRRQTYASMLYLKQRGYIHFQPFLKPTIAGQKFLGLRDFLNLTLPRPPKWDSKWRMVIFDVPMEKNAMRLAFKDRIKALGFRMIQRSVWVYPYECGAEIDQLRTFYRIRDFVTYAVVEHIEDSAALRKLFDLAV